MKISYRWLGRHLDLSGLGAEQLAELLNLSTAEVEGVERFAPVLSEVVVGQVLACERHPDADKLSVCSVDIGQAEALKIVCGAPNVRAGLKVAVAQVGSLLPGDLKIKKSKIRGVESCGMICSERELGLGEEHAGIWELPQDAPEGAAVAEALGALDWVLEIDNKSLTHRPDLWGHRGLATEISAITGRALKPCAPRLPAATGAAPLVRIESAACTRYCALAIDGFQNGKSPLWLRLLLLATGQRPIDLAVDLSNFVMLDLGQPTHAFDRERLSPEGILVRGARAAETLLTLDGTRQELLEGELLITSGGEAVALAGVRGGEASKVLPTTNKLLLECASFHYGSVRRAAQRLGLRTDASARFEKQLSPTLPPLAAAHFFDLLSKLQPGVRLQGPLADVGEWRDPARSIVLRPERVRSVLGLALEDQRQRQILERLGLAVDASDAERWQVRIPSVRSTKDLSIEEDLIEELGRIALYGSIPERALVADLRPAPREERRELVRALQDRLALAAHFNEVLSYSFLPEELGRKLGVLGERYVEVANPVAEGWQRVRRSVAPSLLGKLELNLRASGGVEELRLFEIGKGYQPESLSQRGEPLEVHECALVLCSPRGAPQRFDQSALLRLKGVLEDALANLGHAAQRWIAAGADKPGLELVITAPAWVHPACASFALGAPQAQGPARILASLCTLEPGVLRGLGLEGCEVAVASIWIDKLLESPAAARSYHPLAAFPGTKLDVALAVPAALESAALVAAIERAGKGQAQAITLFDLYTGAQLGTGKKSLAYRLELQAPDKTLAEKDVQRFLERLAREVEPLGGELRRE